MFKRVPLCGKVLSIGLHCKSHTGEKLKGARERGFLGKETLPEGNMEEQPHLRGQKAGIRMSSKPWRPTESAKFPGATKLRRQKIAKLAQLKTTPARGNCYVATEKKGSHWGERRKKHFTNDHKGDFAGDKNKGNPIQPNFHSYSHIPPGQNQSISAAIIMISGVVIISIMQVVVK